MLALGILLAAAVVRGWWLPGGFRDEAREEHVAQPENVEPPIVVPRPPVNLRESPTDHTPARPGSSLDLSQLRDLITEGAAMQARVAGMRGPMALPPADLPTSVEEWEARASAVLASRPELLAQFQAAPAPRLIKWSDPAGDLYDKLGQRIEVLKAIVRGRES